MSVDDDKLIDSVLDKQEGTTKELSDNPKEAIRGQSVVSKDDSVNIDAIMALKRQWGKLREKDPRLRPYKFEEVHIKDRKIVIDEEKYQQRIKEEQAKLKESAEITQKSRGEAVFPLKPMPKFDAKRGFRAYDKEKYEKTGDVEIV